MDRRGRRRELTGGKEETEVPFKVFGPRDTAGEMKTCVCSGGGTTATSEKRVVLDKRELGEGMTGVKDAAGVGVGDGGRRDGRDEIDETEVGDRERSEW